MGGTEKSILVEANIKESADEMADRLCKEVRYEGKHLVAHVLRVLGESVNLQFESLTDVEGGGVVSLHELLPYLRRNSMWSGLVSAELQSDDLDKMAFPKHEGSLLSLLVSRFSSSEGGIHPVFPEYDLVNETSVRGKIGFNKPVSRIESNAEIFHRFSVELTAKDDQELSFRKGLPRIVITNGIMQYGHHLSMSIEVPDENKQYLNIFNLLITRGDQDGLESARQLFGEIREKSRSGRGDSRMDLVRLCAEIATEKGFYPHGAVFTGFDGSMVIGRNDTRNDLDVEKHAEALVMKTVGAETRGHLDCMMSPCPSCTQIIMGSGCTSVDYALMQGVGWRPHNMPIASGLNGLGQKVSFEWQPQHIPKTLATLEKANGSGQIFDGAFRQTHSFNEKWYEDWVERRKVEESRLSREKGVQIFLHPRWGINMFTMDL